MIINPAQLEELLASGMVLEQFGPHRPKVIKLENGEFLKFFRVKHLISKYRFINPAKHFARNAARLAQRGFPALLDVRYYRVPHIQLWAVRYHGLEGSSVRELLQQGQLDDDLIDRLAKFIFTLHEKGVYFRSLHFGNIIVTPGGELGLIDFLDCYFRPRLINFQRNRNFAHLYRYDETKPYQEAISREYKRRQNQQK